VCDLYVALVLLKFVHYEFTVIIVLFVSQLTWLPVMYLVAVIIDVSDD
jgi:hypothetical protein